MANDTFDEIERVFGLLSQQFGTELASVAVDVVDEGEVILVRADLPGYEADDVDVTLRDARTLRITAARERAERDGRYVRRERRQHTADRTVSLPESVESDGTSATYEAGVLTVRLPKRAADGDGETDIPVS